MFDAFASLPFRTFHAEHYWRDACWLRRLAASNFFFNPRLLSKDDLPPCKPKNPSPLLPPDIPTPAKSPPGKLITKCPQSTDYTLRARNKNLRIHSFSSPFGGTIQLWSLPLRHAAFVAFRHKI